MKLGGVICIRNGLSLDFCFKEAIESLLPVCDLVSVSDGESSDGTQEMLREWADRDPRIILNVYPWPNPHHHPEWYADWIQYARMHTPADYIFHLDADEVLHEDSYDEVRRFKERPTEPRFSVTCHRPTFWRDHKHLIPEGQCLGRYVIRMAPQDMFLASDGYDERGTEVPRISVPSSINIMHYGFIRKPEQFFEKERLLQNMYFGSYDKRLEIAQAAGGNWMDHPDVCDYSRNPQPYTGTHPVIMRDWLKERGYD